MSEPRAPYTATLRRMADQADAEALEDMAAEIRGHRNAASFDCHHRNAYGYPVAPEAMDADWDPIDMEALAAIQHDTREALDGFHDDDVVDWIVEEALTQIGRRLRRHGYLRVPRICDLVLSPDGRLTVHPVPGLALEEHPHA